MKISKTHRRFSEELIEPKALTNPEDYLGPNWQDVINFWLFIDGLSESEISKIGDRYWDLDYHVREADYSFSYCAAKEIVGVNVRNAALWAAYEVTVLVVFDFATSELIASHKLLEQDKTLVALPLCLKYTDAL
jgi:hypothetical protein